MNTNKKMDWPNHFIELVVVFIGITAAFSLNNWQEYRKARNLERNYIESLHKDVDSDVVHLNSLIAYNKSNLNAISRLQQLIELRKFSHDSIATYSASMFSVEKFHPQNNYLRDLKSLRRHGSANQFRPQK